MLKFKIFLHFIILLFWILPIKSENIQERKIKIINSKIDEPKETISTPSIPWLKPYIGEKLRVLMFAPYKESRSVVELSQRISMTYKFVPVETGSSTENNSSGEEKWIDFPGMDATNFESSILEIFKPSYDVIILQNIDWTLLPEFIKIQILKKIENEGAGIFFLNDYIQIDENNDEIIEKLFSNKTSDNGFITEGIPLLDIPQYSNFLQTEEEIKKETLVLSIFKNTRVAKLSKTAYKKDKLSFQKSYLENTPVTFEYQWALIIRTLLWVANREPDIRIKKVYLLSDEKEINKIQQSKVEDTTLKIELSNNSGGKLYLKFEIKFLQHDSKVKETIVFSQEIPSGEVIVETPMRFLPIGTTFANIRILEEEKVFCWHTIKFEIIDDGVKIKEIKFDKSFFTPPEHVSGKVFLEGYFIPGSILQISYFDNLRRLIEEKKESLSGRIDFVPFEFKTEPALTSIGDIEVILYDEKGRILEEKFSKIHINKQFSDDFLIAPYTGEYNFVENPSDPIWKTIWDILPDNCINGLFIPTKFDFNKPEEIKKLISIKSEWAVRSNCKIIPNLFIIEEFGENIEEIKKKIAYYYLCYQPFGVNEYIIGGENQLFGEKIDPVLFISKSLPQFQQYIETKYNDIKKVNEIWDTFFRDWTDINVAKKSECKGRNNMAQWIDQIDFIESSYADILRQIKNTLQHISIYPVWIGPDNYFSQTESFSQNYDNEKIVPSVSVLYPYSLKYAFSYCLSQMPSDFIIGNIITYAKELMGREDFNRWLPWHIAFYKGTRIVPTTIIGDKFSVFSPDLTLRENWLWLKEEVDELNSGIVRLLKESKFTFDPIAFVYDSRNYLVDKYILGPTYSQDEWITILWDMGYQPQILTQKQVEEGELFKRNIKLVVLSQGITVTEKMASMLYDFVNKGGVVLADGRPGILDQYLNPVSEQIVPKLFGVKIEPSSELLFLPVDFDIPATERNPKIELNKILAEVDPGVLLENGKALGRAKKIPVMIENEMGRGRTFLLNFKLDYMGLRSKNKEQYMWKILNYIFEKADLQPRCPVTKITKTILGKSETVIFSHNRNLYVGVLRDPLWFFQDNKFSQKELYNYNKPLKWEDVTIEFPPGFCVYDIREKKYLGRMTQVSTKIGPFQAKLFALIPYQVYSISVKCPETVKKGSMLSISCKLDVEGEKPSDHVLSLSILDPNYKEIRYYRKNELAKKGILYTSWYLSLNEKTGLHTIFVRDVATGVTAKAQFEIVE